MGKVLLKHHGDVIGFINHMLNIMTDKKKYLSITKEEKEDLNLLILNPCYYDLLIKMTNNDQWLKIVMYEYFENFNKEVMNIIMLDMNNIDKLAINIYLFLLTDMDKKKLLDSDIKQRLLFDDKNRQIVTTNMKATDWINLLIMLQEEDDINKKIKEKIREEKKYLEVISMTCEEKDLLVILKLGKENKLFSSLKEKLFFNDVVIEKILSFSVFSLFCFLLYLDNNSEIDKQIVKNVFSKKNILKIIKNAGNNSLSNIKNELTRFDIDFDKIIPNGIISVDTEKYVITGSGKHYYFENGIIMIIPSKGVITANMDLGIISYYDGRKSRICVDSHAAVILYLLIKEAGLKINVSGFSIVEECFYVDDSFNKLPSEMSRIGSENGITLIHIEGHTIVFYFANDIANQDCLIINKYFEELVRLDLQGDGDNFITGIDYNGKYLIGDNENLDGFPIIRAKELFDKIMTGSIEQELEMKLVLNAK